MSSRSQPKELKLSKNQLAELEQIKAKLQHAKSELGKYDIKKQRAEESLAIFIKDIDAKKHKVEKEFNKLKNDYELDILTYPDVLQGLHEQKEAVMQSIADAIGELKVIQSNVELQTEVLEKIEKQKKLAFESVKDADNVLIDIEEEIDDKRNELQEVCLQLNKGTKQFNALKEEISKAELELTDLRSDLQTRKNSIEDDMKITIQKSTDVVNRLIELEKREAKMNSDINARIKAVELREQVMARREAKISGLEQKAQEYAKFMKL